MLKKKEEMLQFLKIDKIINERNKERLFSEFIPIDKKKLGENQF